MNLLLLANIARTQLFARKRQTIIATLGVTSGLAMFILMISFMTGVNDLLSDLTLDNAPHIHIYNNIRNDRASIISELYPHQMTVLHNQRPKNEKKSLRNGLQMVQQIQADPRVLGASPLASTQVFYNYGTIQLNGQVLGVDIIQEDRLFKIGSKMREGSITNLLSSSNGVLMGAALAQKLSIEVGDQVTVTTPAGVQQLLKVVGIFATGVTQLDETRCYANLELAQRLLQKDKSYITDINIRLRDIALSKPVALEYNQRFGYTAEDWEVANATILISFTIRNVLTYVVVFTLLTVAGFGIYNILNMTIYEKMKDIAILKATGYAGRDIIGIFMLQAVFIGVMGALSGLLLGFILSYLLSLVPFNMGAFIAMDHMPVNFKPHHYLAGLLFGIITTSLAGWMPSKKAAGIDPVQIFRG